MILVKTSFRCSWNFLKRYFKYRGDLNMFGKLPPKVFFLSVFLVFIISGVSITQEDEMRMRARDLGIEAGILKPGKFNAITDVEGVKVGSVSLIEGNNIRTGVTAILPYDGNIFQQKVPGAVYVINAFGKSVGLPQIEELGTIETPILLTNTLNVPLVADALIEYVINLPGNERVGSVNPVVGETNDGYLNDIRGRHVSKEHVFEAINKASSGPVEEGSVGAGTGTSCLGFKGGIGTSSRILTQSLGGYTVGVLVQTNFGGILRINGAPVGRELKRYYLSGRLNYQVDGSCMIIVATDAPLTPRNLKRLAKRCSQALGRVGSFTSNGSGDYVIAFSTNLSGRVPYRHRERTREVELMYNDNLSPLFLACVEATEEAIYNSMFMAKTITGRGGNQVKAIPITEVKKILEKYNALHWNEKLPAYKE